MQVFSGGICACWISFVKFSSLIPFFDWMYSRMILGDGSSQFSWLISKFNIDHLVIFWSSRIFPLICVSNLILSLMVTFWSRRIGTMFLMWSRIFSPGKRQNFKTHRKRKCKKTQKCESTKMLTWYSLCEGQRQNSPSASVPIARSCSTWVQTWTMSISSKPNPVKYMNLNWSFANLICHLAKLVNVALVVLHALLRQVQMGRELGKISMNHEFKSNIWR